MIDRTEGMTIARCFGLARRGSIVALTLLPAPLAASGEVEDFWQPAWTCGQSIDLSADLILTIASRGSLIAHPGTEELPAFGVAELPPPMRGTLLLAQTKAGWRGYPIEWGAEPQGIYIAPEAGNVVVITMHTIGDPGSSYTVLRATKAFRSIDCRETDFPADLNVDENGQSSWLGEYLSFEDFNMRADGTGAIVGSAVLNRETATDTRWYRYTTRDGGKSWSAPERLDGKPASLDGSYTRIDSAVQQ
jgi:hypothetical protein